MQHAMLCDCATIVGFGSLCTGSCTVQVMELEEAEVHGIWQAVATHTPQRLATINQMHTCLEVGLMLSGCTFEDRSQWAPERDSSCVPNKLCQSLGEMRCNRKPPATEADTFMHQDALCQPSHLETPG